MIFSANVRQQEIAFISVGNSATVPLDVSNGQTLPGVVEEFILKK